MSIWICSVCHYSRVGPSYRRRVPKEFAGEIVGSLEIMCQICFDTAIDIDPSWDWVAEGWKEKAG